MRLFANKDIKHLFCAITIVMVLFLLVIEAAIWILYGGLSLVVLLLFVLFTACLLAICFRYFNQQNKVMEEAVLQINAYLDGDTNARTNVMRRANYIGYFIP